MTNLLVMSAFAFILVLSSCSKETVEPEPADQVLGVYNGTTYSESLNGIEQSIDLTNDAIKNDLTISMEVAKKSANVISIVLQIAQRDSIGTMQTSSSTYETLDLKSIGNGDFDIQNGGISIGQIGNGILKLQESYSDTDSNGNTVQVAVTIAAKKS
ncbi:MAG: hypothetical protein R2822_05320 [Spirosomataceae bacterium]